VLAVGVPREARREDRAAVGLRAQGGDVPRVRRLPRGRLSPALARDRRSRWDRTVELSGALAERAAGGEPDLRRAGCRRLNWAPPRFPHRDRATTSGGRRALRSRSSTRTSSARTALR